MASSFAFPLRLVLLVSTALSSSSALAQVPSNEELYKLVMGLKAEQEKLREENRRVKAEADEARAEIRRLRGQQQTTVAKIDAVAKAASVKPVAKGHAGPSVTYEAANSCAAYGAGYNAIGNSGTCVRLGGYVRAEGQFTPQQTVYQLGYIVGNTGFVQQVQNGNVQDTVGTEVRGRADLDAYTPTDWGDARVSVKLRVSSLTGSRTARIANNQDYTYFNGVELRVVPEAAFMSLGGLTVGLAPSNYALMPTSMYTGTPWAQYTNGVVQISYKHNFGSGWSATGALERAQDWAYSMAWNRPSTAVNLVGNVKWEQQWGWIALQGVFSGNSVEIPDSNLQPSVPDPLDPGAAQLYGGDTDGQKRYNAGAIGFTANVKLPMISPKNQMWFTANYANGNLGALLAAGGLSNISTQNNGSLFGGILRVDQNMMVTSGFGTETSPYQVRNVQGFNIAAMLTHYWSDRWRSNFNAGYVQINPPRSLAYDGQPFRLSDAPIPMWGRGQLYSVAGSLIYSIAENFDVGVEAAYGYIRNQVQNAPGKYELVNMGGRIDQMPIPALPGLSQGNAIFKMRMDRLF